MTITYVRVCVLDTDARSEPGKAMSSGTSKIILNELLPKMLPTARSATGSYETSSWPSKIVKSVVGVGMVL